MTQGRPGKEMRGPSDSPREEDRSPKTKKGPGVNQDPSNIQWRDMRGSNPRPPT